VLRPLSLGDRHFITKNPFTLVYNRAKCILLLPPSSATPTGVKFVSTNLDDFARVQSNTGFDALWAPEPKLQVIPFCPLFGWLAAH
jgi:hypothetical protein